MAALQAWPIIPPVLCACGIIAVKVSAIILNFNGRLTGMADYTTRALRLWYNSRKSLGYYT